MDAADYAAAYRKIIPPNLSRWVVFRHGTVFELPERHVAVPSVDPGSEAIAFLREHGPVLAGSSSGDFRSIRLKDHLGWLVTYEQDGMFNYIPAAECPDPAQGVVVGLMGRERRAKDAAGLEVIHVEQPENEAPSNPRMDSPAGGGPNNYARLPRVMRTLYGHGMKLRAAVATGMSTAVFGAYLLLSDAPPPVHAVTAAAFLVAFWVPAMCVHEPADLWARKYPLLALVLVGVATFDVGLSATISKKELLDAPMLFIVGAPAMVGLLAVHGAIVRRISRATVV